MELWRMPGGDWVQEDIQRFARQWADVQRLAVDPEDFRKFRLQNGIYGIRDEVDRFMVRIKVPFGVLSATQLAAVATATRAWAPLGVTHVTTRQDFQLHRVPAEAVPELLEHLAGVGLTTREACGNTVRNVTCCPQAGVSPTEIFDVRPYARAVVDHFFRNPLGQNLPRKMKFAFEGCTEDHARIPIHDIGATALLRDGQRGFALYVGGGLGTIRMSAVLLEPFTPAEDLLLTCEAIVRVFDRHGNRADRSRARLKFLVREWGIDRFREAVERERRSLKTVWSGPFLPDLSGGEEAPDVAPGTGTPPPAESAAEVRWRLGNASPQRQEGWYCVTIRCPLGDVTADGMEVVADVASRCGCGEVRTTIGQNLLLPWIPADALPGVYRELAAVGLASEGAGAAIDITRCPGADTCNMAITHSRGLAAALTDLLDGGLGDRSEVRALQLKISGCPNSCGQHAIADLGFSGTSRRLGDREVPHYLLQAGGYTLPGQAVFGRPLLQIPARRVPEAVRALLGFYGSARMEEEDFATFVDRLGTGPLKEVLVPFQTIPEDGSASWYEDLGAEGVRFETRIGEGECAT